MNTKTTLKEIMISMIKSIDLISYLLKHHHRRVAIIAYHLGKQYQLDEKSLSNLVLAASLHDIGALSIKERDQLIQIDMENPHPHATLGAVMLKSFSHFKDISNIIKYHHWKWEFGTNPNHDNTEIPIESYLLHLADRIDISIDPNYWIIDQVDTIKSVIIENSGTLFRPDCVDAFLKISEIDSFWLDIDNLPMENLLNKVLSHEEIALDMNLLESLAYTFSRIIDFRSKFTATHSYGVGMVASEIARFCNLSDSDCKKMKIAGFLHDIGKIGIPNEIIEKDNELSSYEFNKIKAHAYYTHLILCNIAGLKEICQWAAMHHEKHDGTGYPYRLSSREITLEMDILSYADRFTALSEDRPYRKGLQDDQILVILESDNRGSENPLVLSAIKNNFTHLNEIRKLAQSEAFKDYQDAVFNRIY